MLGKILKPTLPSKIDTKLKETYKKKLIKLHLIKNSLYYIIRTIYTTNFISQVGILELASKIWKLIKTLY